MANTQASSGGVRVKVQRFGSFLSGMVMPNIGAFIAWGIITALFIPTGWWPNENLAELVGPTITYLLPLLIGFTGGKLLHDVRGGVVGALATMGVIVGTDIPMFLGAMIMGPLGGYIIRQVDRALEGKVKAGFEMLVNNFSVGIIGGLLMLGGFEIFGPIMSALDKVMAAGVDWIVGAKLLPVASLFIEPAKVLFLNNAINHGILSPLGVDQVAEAGKSVLFLLEANPGPGLGLLLAYMFFAKGAAKRTAPGAAIIHFLGGIHEIYFPYVLMKPILILAMIAGGATGIFTFVLFDVGLVAPASPGSIFAILAMASRGSYLGLVAGIFLSAAVTFAVASVILKSSAAEEVSLEEATQNVSAMKGKQSYASALVTDRLDKVDHIIFACDAGMGSSAMGASVLRNKVNKANLPIKVTNTSISNLPKDAQFVITHEDLTERAEVQAPNAIHRSVTNFLNADYYDQLVEEIKAERSKIS
ncbi:PTS mannitol transporter subunit IICB [Exiguobacterium sp. B2(2022)]|uniref:PTS mannitol transporter subunit IICB n=1 Tax=Exiguobacterium sp. B2(2022) TaxID=2992755 RepID=UPI00237AE486|nr:PTS mannitol transporter subunit IICBA [Exiguobacterium sp. B2(2022)]MDE0563227.1 PTS mannitol transporter subunit IICBA [Exiguobacterium sp. B2(2022)]